MKISVDRTIPPRRNPRRRLPRCLSAAGMVFLAAGLALASSSCAGGLGFIKKRLPPPQQVEDGYLFQFSSPSAQIVQLCGSWEENNWCNGQAETGGFRIGEMHDEDGDGIWELVVKLEPGRYEYKFKIDNGNWKEDPNNPERTDDGYGGFNSIVSVED